MNVLVGYASAHGSTAEVAQGIGKVLEDWKNTVTVADVAEVQSIEGYDAFVLGSAIHGGMWLTEMSQFLARFNDTLAVRPLYFFMTCIRVLEPDGYEHCVQEYVDHRVLDRLHTREIVPFAGRLEMKAVEWSDRWTLAARYDGQQPPGSYNNDFREWNKINAWAEKIARELAQK